MSRIGRKPIDIPAGVTVTVDDKNLVTVTGKLGTLSQQVAPIITVKVEGNQVVLTRPNDQGPVKAKHGLYRMLVANMVTGVSEGFKKAVDVNGVGYKVQKSGNKVVMNIGFSHPVDVYEEEGITLDCPNPNQIVISGISKEKVGQVAAMIRSIKPVEPYHAYGIKYSDEVVIKKVGKVSGKK